MQGDCLFFILYSDPIMDLNFKRDLIVLFRDVLHFYKFNLTTIEDRFLENNLVH